MKELLTPEALLTNFKDARTLTRKVIEAFPEKDLFEFSNANLRPFSQMVKEFLMITDYIFTEILHEKHTSFCNEEQFPTLNRNTKCNSLTAILYKFIYI